MCWFFSFVFLEHFLNLLFFLFIFFHHLLSLLSPRNLFFNLSYMNISSQLLFILFLYLHRLLHFSLLLCDLFFVSLFLFTLNSSHFCEKIFYFFICLTFMLPIVLLSELQQILNIRLSFLLKRGQTKHTFLHIMQFS